MALLPNVEYKALLSYVPHDDSERAGEFNTISSNLKNDKKFDSGMLMSESIAQAVSMSRYFSDYFGPNTVLIPTPKSSLLLKDDLWVPRRITTALCKKGLGISVECLERIRSIRKSSTSAGNRPKAIEHYETMRVNPTIEPKEIIIVDDVITKGATIIGAASLLANAFPNARIRAFVAMRALYRQNFREIVYPYTGTIVCDGGDTWKE